MPRAPAAPYNLIRRWPRPIIDHHCLLIGHHSPWSSLGDHSLFACSLCPHDWLRFSLVEAVFHLSLPACFVPALCFPPPPSHLPSLFLSSSVLPLFSSIHRTRTVLPHSILLFALCSVESSLFLILTPPSSHFVASSLPRSVRFSPSSPSSPSFASHCGLAIPILLQSSLNRIKVRVFFASSTL